MELFHTENSKISSDENPLKVRFVPIPKTRSESFQKVFPGCKGGLVKSDPGGFVTIPLIAENIDVICKITPRKDDVWLLSFYKTGTNWVSEMLWLMKNDCDFERALNTLLTERTFYPERPSNFVPSTQNTNPADCPFVRIHRMTSPRIFRTYLPFYLLPANLLDTSKVVYLTRNPKDVIVSYFYHLKMWKIQGFEGSIDELAQYFMDNEVINGPFFPLVLDAWDKRHHPNMHFIFYEDLKKDLRGELKKMATFLGMDLSENKLNRLIEHLKFKNFQNNEAVNREHLKKNNTYNEEYKFIRKGIVGDWKNHFSPEMNRKLDLWIEKNLEGTDLKFVIELEDQE